MNYRTLLPLIAAAILTFPLRPACADSEAGNSLHVFAATYGTHYAKSIPAEPYGPKGETRIYRVTKGQDELEHTFDWYANRMYLQNTYRGTSVVRIGTALRGHEASKDDLAIAFYLDGKLLKEYSTLDIAGKALNVSRSVSHYRVVEKISGYRWMKENDYVFDIQTQDGKSLSFDIGTGEIILSEKVTGLAAAFAATNTDVLTALRELTTIKPGMTRADLLTVCATEGGISSRAQRTYVYRHCVFIKVNVTFRPFGNEQDKSSENNLDQIITISQPYLQNPVLD